MHLLTTFWFRYAFPWWREKEIDSVQKRSHGLCPLTPEETALILQALGFGKETQIYIASGEIYGSGRRLAALRAAFPRIVSLSPTVCVSSFSYLIMGTGVQRAALHEKSCS